MNVAEVMADLDESGVFISISGPDKLTVEAPMNTLTTEVIDRIRKWKPKIISYLHGESRPQRVFLYWLEGYPRPLYFVSPVKTVKEARERIELKFGADRVIDVQMRFSHDQTTLMH